MMNDTAHAHGGDRSLSWVRKRLLALRAFSFPVSVLPVLVAAAVVQPLGQWQWPLLIASVAGVALLHAAGNLLNDYFDFRSGLDHKTEGDEGRPGRLLVRGQLQPRDVAAEAAACLLLAIPIGVYLVWQCGLELLWFGLGAVFFLYAYTGPPLKLKYRALGELVIFITFGPLLMLGAAFVHTGRLDLPVLLISIPVGLATTGIVLGNNLRDLQEDGQGGIVTLAQLAGGKPARVLYVFMVAGCVVGLAVLALTQWAPRVVVLVPLVLVLLWKPIVQLWRGQRLPDIDVQTARFVSVLLVFLLVAFLVDGMW